MAFRDERITKVSFKRCSPSEKQLFSKSNCIMPISVGQKMHEGEKFYSTMKLINASFQECTILVDDSIQRHTMKIQNDQEEDILHQLANQAGDNWLTRNSISYESLDIPYKILRWDDWLNHTKYSQSYEQISSYYQNNTEYRNELNKSIVEFLARYVQKPENINFNYEKAFNCCIDYLMEECAVMCLWAESAYLYEVYPTGRNRAMITTYEMIIKSAYPGYLKSVSLYFEKSSTKADSSPIES